MSAVIPAKSNDACFGAQAYKTYRLGGKLSELLYSPAAFGIDLSHQDMPRPRAYLIWLPP